MNVKTRLRNVVLTVGPSGRAFGEVRFQRMKRKGMSPELEACLSVLAPGATAIDVGAAKGGYAYAFAKAVGGSGLVIACEPNPESFRQLDRTTWGSAVRAQQLGVGAVPGELDLHVPQATGGGIDAGLATFTGAFTTDDLTVTVPVSTIDAISAHLDAVALIKIDVEGWELEVLRGAEATVDTFRPIMVVECERRHLNKIDQTDAAFLDWAEDHGYSVDTIGHPDLTPTAAFDAQDAFHADGATSYFSGTYPNNFLLTPL